MGKRHPVKSKAVQIRMTPVQWQTLREAAHSSGLGLSTLMLHETLEAVARRKAGAHG